MADLALPLSHQGEIWDSWRTGLADAPWPEKGGGKSKRGADRHYDVLPVREIPAVMMSSPLWRPHECAHLYFWATNNYMPAAFWAIEQLGFTYKTMITWAKPHYGRGRYFRGQTEHLLFCTRGPFMATGTANTSTLLEAKKRKHSQKPLKAYNLIEANSPGPYVEFFGRRKRKGWQTMGNEL